jgi:flagellar hook-associated protein 2
MALGLDASSSSVSFNGLQSGLDSGAIVESAVKVAEQPKRHLERQQAILTAHVKTYGQISAQLKALQSTAQQMTSHTTLEHLAAHSSSPHVVTATAGGGATLGQNKVQVVALAAAQRTYSAPVASAVDGAMLGSGSFVMRTADGRSLVRDVDDTTTLTDISEAINNAGLGAQAVLIYDGQAYRLQVTATASGQAQALTFEDDGLTLGLSDPNNTSQKAQDAQFILDGFSTISRPTNVISDVIPGLTLQLHTVSSDVQTVSTQIDADAIVNQVDQFVSSYNALQTSLAQATHYDGVTDRAKSVGDTTLITLSRTLQQTIGRPIAQLTGDIKALPQVGLASQKDGTLKLDRVKLRQAIDQDPQGVGRLFVFDPTTQTRGVASQIDKLATNYTTVGTGVLTNSIDSMMRQHEALQVQIGKIETNVKKYEATLKDRYTQLEKDMAQIKSQNNYIEALKPQPRRN